ncbi:MAG: PilN domain-containing protein [Terriglobia bacterium]
MIRINLLGRPRPKVKRRIAIAGTLQLGLFVIPLLAALLLLYYDYSTTKSEISNVKEKITTLKAEKESLKDVEVKIQQAQKKKSDLETLQSVIKELESKKTGPANLLDAIGSTVNQTETLWLTRLDEQRGGKITLEGVAGSVNALANFITNLKATGFFKNIEIKEAVQSTQNPNVENYTFSLSCDFVLPESEQTTSETPTSAGRT